MFKSALQNVVDALNLICDPDNSMLHINLSEGDPNEGCPDGDAMIFTEAGSSGAFSNDEIYKAAGKTETTFPSVPPLPFSSAEMWLNVTDEFKQGHFPDAPPHCWSGNCNGSFTVANGAECMDLETILMHEIGHMLGLAHLGGVENNPGFDTFGDGCNTDNSMLPDDINNETIKNGYDEHTFGNRSNISCYMWCAMAQLYCPTHAFTSRVIISNTNCIPDPTDVKEILVSTPNSPYIELYPQPSAQIVTLVIRTNVKYLTLDVYSRTGSLVEKRRIEMRGTSEIFTLPVHEYPSGVYYIVLFSDEGLTSARFVVSH